MKDVPVWEYGQIPRPIHIPNVQGQWTRPYCKLLTTSGFQLPTVPHLEGSQPRRGGARLRARLLTDAGGPLPVIRRAFEYVSFVWKAP